MVPGLCLCSGSRSARIFPAFFSKLALPNFCKNVASAQKSAQQDKKRMRFTPSGAAAKHRKRLRKRLRKKAETIFPEQSPRFLSPDAPRLRVGISYLFSPPARTETSLPSFIRFPFFFGLFSVFSYLFILLSFEKSGKACIFLLTVILTYGQDAPSGPASIPARTAEKRNLRT